MKGRTLTVRAIALLSAGSAAVHQLRYAIGYGDGAGHALAAHPHAYLQLAVPAAMTAVILSTAVLLMRVARGSAAATGSMRPIRGAASAPPRRRAHLLVLWLACALALAAVYGVQETLEGAGAFAGGGWIGLALAVPIGLAVAVAIRGGEAAELRVAPVDLRLFVTLVGRVLARGSSTVLAPPARRLGARAPPVASVA